MLLLMLQMPTLLLPMLQIPMLTLMPMTTPIQGAEVVAIHLAMKPTVLVGY
jgi:hypothetical protein